eukprot:Em0015g1075a
MATVRLLPTPRWLSCVSHYARSVSTSEGALSSERPHVSAAAFEKGCTGYYCNRNPRNLELLGLADKPKGFETKNQRVDYYHRLMLDVSSRHVTAYVNHNNGVKVVEASTKEMCIARHLYKTSDVCAAFNVGRVLAARCKETGLYRVMWEHKFDREHKKVKAFIKAFSRSGVRLHEPKVRKTLPPPGTLPI